MMAGGASNQMVNFPYTRLFQAANTSRLNLTPAAQMTGEWYGSTDYQAGFKKLWGLG
jgi:ribose transport system substrate-binding protein